jgi:uncharacterized protein with ATP-grasp and redox domains
MSKQVTPIDPSLSLRWKEAKARLSEAQAALLKIESDIYEATQEALGKMPEKGTLHVTGMVIDLGFTEKWDDQKLHEIAQNWSKISNNPFPFKPVWKADGKSVSYLRDNAKEAYDKLAEALTLTPRKPSFKAEE